MALTRSGARYTGPRKARSVGNRNADTDPPRPIRHAADCRLDARDWEALARWGKGAEAIAAGLRLTIDSTRDALDAARARVEERKARK